MTNFIVIPIKKKLDCDFLLMRFVVNGFLKEDGSCL